MEKDPTKTLDCSTITFDLLSAVSSCIRVIQDTVSCIHNRETNICFCLIL